MTRPLRPLAGRRPAAGRGALGGAINTNPTGNVGGDLAKAIVNTIQANRQNAAANALMNQGPTGQLGGGVTQNLGQLPSNVGAPQDFTLPSTQDGLGPNVGSLIHTGGTGELAMQQQQQAADAAQQTAALNQAYRRAQIAHLLQGPDQASQQIKQTQLQIAQERLKQLQNPKAAKPGKYEAGSSTPDDASYYDFNHQRADFDAQHGKGSFDRLAAASGYIQQDPNTGDWVVSPDAPTDKDGKPLISVDKKGNVTLAPQGSFPGATIPQNDLQSNMARYDATLNRQGQTPRYLGTGGYMGSQNPQSGIASGDQANPYTPKTTTDLQAIPDGQWFVSPRDGKTYQKQGSQPQAPAPQRGQPQASADQTTPDQVASASPDVSAQGPPPQLPGMVPTSTPSSFNLSQQPASGDMGQGTSLADAIRQASIANQLQGVV